MSLVCVTNEMPDTRSCTLKDAHTIVCKADEDHGGHGGWEYRLVTKGYDKTTFEPILEYVATGRVCKGCVPTEARVGLLCMTCWLRLEQALAKWDEFAQIIKGYDKMISRDGGGASAEGYVPIPATRLAVNEGYSYLKGLTEWTAAREWVSREAGARNAVLFTHAAEVAYRSHPIEEAARKLRRVRCPACAQLSFIRLPPEAAGRPVTVQCQNPGCGKTITEESKLVEIAKIERLRRA